eukprot:4857643-Pyramimonas_sp.AAC.1
MEKSPAVSGVSTAIVQGFAVIVKASLEASDYLPTGERIAAAVCAVQPAVNSLASTAATGTQ